MKELIHSIARKHAESGIKVHIPATISEIAACEERIGFSLPDDFREFYLIANGFECEEDLFNLLPLSEIGQRSDDYGDQWVYFSEYLIYSDMWGLRINTSGQYEIFNGTFPEKPLTSSLIEFLERFLKGDVFEPYGLYEWQKELGII